MISPRWSDLIYNSTGRVIVAGIGKSGIVGRKIVATLNSTGTRSLFLHPVEAMHGDLGSVRRDDIFIALSNSGETDELNILLPSIRRIGCKVIAFTGNKHRAWRIAATLSSMSRVACEACPLGLAPDRQHHGPAGHGGCPGRGAAGKEAFQIQRFQNDPSRRQSGSAAFRQDKGSCSQRKIISPGSRRDLHEGGDHGNGSWPIGRRPGVDTTTTN